MQPVRRLFQKFRSCLIRRTFTGRLKDSGIDKIRKDSINIIFEAMFVPEPAAYFIKLETIVKSLGKKISSTIEDLLAIVQLLVRMKSYLDSFGLLLLFIFKSFRRLRNARTRINTGFSLLQNKTTPHWSVV